MNIVLRLLATIPVIVYYVLEAIVFSLVPRRLRYKDVSKDTVLITGAGNGIGRELAKRFATLGARIILLDINLKGLKETESLITASNRGVFIYECDVSKREAIYAVAAKIKDEVGSVTMLINNAGIVTGKTFLDCPDELIQKTMDVNAMAHFWTCKAFLPDMVAANSGHIVSVASLAGMAGIRMLTDYCASKFAAVGFEESLRIELDHDKLNIKTTVVAPYLVHTGLFEGSKVRIVSAMTPQRVADSIVSGILTNQEVVIIPGYLRIFLLLQAVLPRQALRAIYEATEISTFMNTFRGREHSNGLNDREIAQQSTQS